MDLVFKPLLIPCVIAESHRIGNFKQFSCAVEGDPAAGGGVFAVDHNELGVELPPQVGEQGLDGASAAFTDNVSEKDKGHFQ